MNQHLPKKKCLIKKVLVTSIDTVMNWSKITRADAISLFSLYVAGDAKGMEMDFIFLPSDWLDKEESWQVENQ